MNFFSRALTFQLAHVIIFLHLLVVGATKKKDEEMIMFEGSDDVSGVYDYPEEPELTSLQSLGRKNDIQTTLTPQTNHFISEDNLLERLTKVIEDTLDKKLQDFIKSASPYLVMSKLEQFKKLHEELPNSGCSGSVKCYSDRKCYCYTVVDKSLSWDEARENCQNLGGDLVSIRNEEEQHFVDKVSRRLTTRRLAWIGTDRNLVWSDGSNSTYTNWEAEHSAELNQCGYMRNNGKWKVFKCKAKAISICRFG